MKKILAQGFTLVELLIVIGLLGAIALIVIAAINPIEQANRARDARFRADGGQLVSAIDRYFAAKSEFPWMSENPAYTTEDSFGFTTASDPEVGLCSDGPSSCSTAGHIIAGDELKTEFMTRDFIKKGGGAADDLKIFVGKDAGSSASVYACFIPLSNSNKEKGCSDDKVYTIDSSGTRTLVSSGSCTDLTAWVTNGWYVCIPE